QDSGFGEVRHVPQQRGDARCERAAVAVLVPGGVRRAHRLRRGRCGRAPGRGAGAGPPPDGRGAVPAVVPAGPAPVAPAIAGAAAARAASLDRLACTRRVSALYSGAASVRSTTIGVARNSEEYAPEASPTKRMSARSLIVPTPRMPAPTNSSPATGSSAISEVLIERIRV